VPFGQKCALLVKRLCGSFSPCRSVPWGQKDDMKLRFRRPYFPSSSLVFADSLVFVAIGGIIAADLAVAASIYYYGW
jgi:hypothetical protein